MKIVKQDIIDHVFNAMAHKNVTKVQCQNAVDALLNVITTRICDGHPIRIQGLGKLVPYLKKGGRPVRNFATGELIAMPERFVVSFITQAGKSALSHKKMIADSEKPTLGLWDLINELTDSAEMRRNYSSYRTALTTRNKMVELSEATVRVFNDMVKESRENGLTIELRGFGTFKTTKKKANKKRNPKTGETIVTDCVKVRTVFTEGKALRKALDAITA